MTPNDMIVYILSGFFVFLIIGILLTWLLKLKNNQAEQEDKKLNKLLEDGELIRKGR